MRYGDYPFDAGIFDKLTRRMAETRMLRAATTGSLGLGVTLLSTFAGGLGLSLRMQRVGFAIGGLLVLLAIFLFIYGWRHRRDLNTPEDGPVPEPHFEQLQELAGAYAQSVGYERCTRGKQPTLLEQSFWSHFPAVGRVLERWDEVLKVYEGAQEDVRDWLCANGGASVGATLTALGPAVEHDSGFRWTVDSGYLWLNGGFGIAPVNDDTDVDALKRAYEDLLANARASPEAKVLRAAALDARATKHVALTELAGIQALHVVRGKCALC